MKFRPRSWEQRFKRWLRGQIARGLIYTSVIPPPRGTGREAFFKEVMAMINAEDVPDPDLI